MKKIKLLMAAMLPMMAWNGVMAQTDAELNAAITAITDGETYRIKTDVKGTDYYVTTAGALTNIKDDAGFFQITKTEGGDFKSTSFRISSGDKRFTNSPISNNAAVLHPNPAVFSTTTSDRGNASQGYWERQVLFLNENGKYAIRSCNTPYATSGWGDCGRTFWTWDVEPVAACYSYEPAYVWELEVPPVIVNVTYKLVESDGTTVVSSTTKKQEANSAIADPLPGTGMDFNGFFHEKFYYDYAVSGTIGDTDCTITITRTEKAGLVKSLDDLSNTKAYYIGCDRGALLTKDGTIASTSHSTLHDAAPANFAILSYEDENYIYSIADKKFVLNNGSLAEMPSHGTFDAIQMTAQTVPYFLFTFKIDDSTTYGLNTNGTGALNGCVINNWVTPDAGDQYYMVEVADFDPTEALAELEAYFHPSCTVTYIIKDAQGNELERIEGVPTTPGAKITSLPEDYKRPFTTYNELDITVSEEETEAVFTATWAGPFDLSTSAEDATWYYMTIRGSYYVAVDASEPYYPKSDKDLSAAESQWAFVGNAYNGIAVINKAKGDGWTLTKDGDMAVMREGNYTWTIGKNSDGFTLKETGTEYNCINQSGGSNGPLKFWNSSASPTDNGSTFRVTYVPVPVTYDVVYNNDIVTSVTVNQVPGSALTLPAQLENGYVEYADLSGTVTAANQHVEVTATWDLNDLPFEVAPDFESVIWQNLAMRGTWFVTSDQKAADGALLTVNANAMGLVEDAYKWAFIGTDPYHIMLVNKLEGEGRAFIHTANTNQGIPAFADIADVETESDLYWHVRKSKSSIENSFMLNVLGTNLSINQYGGEGGSVKFWDSANNISDGGSAFTIFDIPTNFAEFTGTIEAVMTSEATGYFTLNEATKALWKAEYKTTCNYEKYVELQEAIDNISNFVLPETGYYTLKNKNYGTYMGIDPSDATLWGNYQTANAAKNIVKLTKTGDATYTISLMGKFAPATVADSQPVVANTEAGTYTLVIPAIGYGAFQADTENNMSVLHTRGAGDLVGWEATAAASQWAVEDATSIEFTIGDAGYATAYLPCPVAIPDTINAYTGKMADSYWLVLSEVGDTIPAATPVILEAKAGTYTLAIADDVDAIDDNDLKGTFEPIEAVGKYVLAKPEDKVGFYLAESGTIAAGKAYLELEQPSDVKAFFFTNGVATGIANVEKTVENGAIYNIAGQRVNKAQKGIYIVNGKKVVK